MIRPCRKVRFYSKEKTVRAMDVVGKEIKQGTMIRIGNKKMLAIYVRPSPCYITYTTKIEVVEKCDIRKEELGDNVLITHVCDENKQYFIYPKKVWEEVETKYIQPLSYGNPPVNPGLLLVGPPGTGKSSLLSILATSYGLHTEFLDTGILSPYLGESERNVREICSNARNNEPSLIIGDEIEWLLQARKHAEISGHSASLSGVISFLLREIQEWKNENRLILFASATNISPEYLDQAFLRAGRFGKPVIVPLPDVEAVKELMVLHGIKEKEADILSRQIVNAGLPMSDVMEIIELMKQGKKPKIESKRFRGYSRFVPNPTEVDFSMLKKHIPPKIFENPRLRMICYGEERLLFPVISEYLLSQGKSIMIVTDPRYIDEAMATADVSKAILIVFTEYIPAEIQKLLYVSATSPIIYIGKEVYTTGFRVDETLIRHSLKKKDLIKLMLDFYDIKYTDKDLHKLLRVEDRDLERILMLLPDIANLDVDSIIRMVS